MKTYNEGQQKGREENMETLSLIEYVNMIKSFECGKDAMGWKFWISTLSCSDCMKGRIMKELGLLDYGQTI